MSTQTATPLLNAEQTETIANTLAEFDFFGHGSNDEYAARDRAYFIRLLNDPTEYFGGMFEYCNRPSGVRVHVALAFDRQGVRYVNLSRDNASARFTEEQVQAANERMAAVL